MRAWPVGLIGLLSPLLWAGLWSWGIYQPSGKGKSGPIQMPSERVQEAVLCTAWFIQGQIKKKISKLRVTGLCAGNSPVTGEFPAHMASNAANVSIWWRHHVPSLSWLATGRAVFILKRTAVFISMYASSNDGFHVGNNTNDIQYVPYNMYMGLLRFVLFGFKEQFIFVDSHHITSDLLYLHSTSEVIVTSMVILTCAKQQYL